MPVSVAITSVALAGVIIRALPDTTASGATSAAGIIGVDMGKLILIGIVALPSMLIGNLWANYAGKRMEFIYGNSDYRRWKSHHPCKIFFAGDRPDNAIAVRSFNYRKIGGWLNIFSIGRTWLSAYCLHLITAVTGQEAYGRQLQESVEKAGGIL